MDSISVDLSVKKNDEDVGTDDIKEDDDKNLPLDENDVLTLEPSSPSEVDSINVNGDNIDEVLVTVYDEDGNPTDIEVVISQITFNRIFKEQLYLIWLLNIVYRKSCLVQLINVNKICLTFYSFP